MQTQDPETYTAALRRLADERASGLLTTAAGQHTVVVRLDSGRTTGIGPLHGASTDLDDPVLRATLVQRLLERLVDGVVRETASWSFDDDGDDQVLAPVPDSLPAELSRRAVDAASALRRVGPDAVLRPDGAPGMGEAAAVLHGALDGSSTLTEVATHVQRPLTAVAGLAVALLTSGRASLVTPETPTVAPGPTHVVSAPTASTPKGTKPTMADLATPKLDDDDAAIDWSTVDEDDEPAMWVMAGDGAPATPEKPAPAGPPTTSTLTSADVSGDDWADTSWLDELSPAPGHAAAKPAAKPTQSAPAPGSSSDGAPGTPSPEDRDERASSAAEFAGLLGDLAGVGSEPSAPATPEPDPAPAAADERNDAAEPEAAARRRRPRGDDVADFLRELSRLALEDES